MLDLVPIKTNPEKIRKILKQFIDIFNAVNKRYAVGEIKNSSKKMIIQSKKIDRKSVILSMKEAYRIESIDKISYNLMINKKFNDLHVIKSKDFSKRMLDERTKFFPSGPTFSPFLTPVGLNTAERTISVQHGVIGIDPEDVKKFRLARVVQQRKNLVNQYERIFYFDKDFLSNPVGKFNIAIADATLSNMQLKAEGSESDFIDAKEYVGADSYFVIDIPRLLKRSDRVKIKKQMARNFDILTDILPQKFLRKKGEIKSLSELDPGNTESRLFRLKTNIQVKTPSLPPQIQVMTTNRPGGMVEYVDVDPLRNRETRPIIEETQKNVHELLIMTGFERHFVTGLAMLNNPLWRTLRSDDLNSDKISLVKSTPWTEQVFGFFGSKNLPPINNSLIILNDNPSFQSSNAKGTIQERRRLVGYEMEIDMPDAEGSRQEITNVNTLSDLSLRYLNSNIVSQNENKSPLLKILKNIPQQSEDSKPSPPLGTNVSMTPTQGGGNNGGGSSGY